MICLALQFTAYTFAIFTAKKSVNLRNLPFSFCCAKPISSNNMMQKAFISLHILKYVVQVMLEDHTDEIGHTKNFALSYQKLKSVPNMRSTADFSDLP